MQRLKTMRSAFTLLATALLLPVPVVRAQITRNITDGTTPPGIAPGAPAGSYRLSDLDNINLYSGNLNFRLPLLEVAGRGEARYSITLPIEHHWTIDGMAPLLITRIRAGGLPWPWDTDPVCFLTLLR